jgi:hypothetical protein
MVAGPYGCTVHWFSIPVVFSIEAPTADAARLLAEQQHAPDLVALLDYPSASVSTLGADLAAHAETRFDRHLVSVTVTLEAENAQDAVAVVRDAIADMDLRIDDFREVRPSSESADPRLLAEETKHAIERARDWLTDHLRIDAESLADGASYDDAIVLCNVLPRSFAHHYTPPFLDRMIGGIERVADKLTRYPDTYLASTAEELAAHALIDEARVMFETTENATDEQSATGLRELEELHELAFEDHDVLFLFDARFDGIESSEIAEAMGMANLHVRDWFEPFRPDEA